MKKIIQIFISLTMILTDSYAQITWSELGISSSDINEMEKLKVTPQEYKDWTVLINTRNSDHRRKEIIGLKEAGVTYQEYKDWKALLYSSSYGGPELIIGLKEAGVTYQEYKDWKALVEYRSFEWDMIRLKRDGVTYQDYKSWKAAGIKSCRDILKLKEIGFTHQKYLPYKGIKNVYKVKKLLQWNIKPTKLIIGMSYLDDTFFPCFRNEKEFKANLQFLQENNCKTIRNRAFSEADEYDNEGNCYLFNAELFQRLDRHTGLASGVSGGSFLNYTYYGSTIFVEFDQSWRENASHAGIIKGLGNFEYETSSGTTKNVAKGKVIRFIR